MIFSTTYNTKFDSFLTIKINSCKKLLNYAGLDLHVNTMEKLCHVHENFTTKVLRKPENSKSFQHRSEQRYEQETTERRDA